MARKVMQSSIRILLWIFIAAIWCAGSANAQDKLYNKPRWQDERLDWCSRWGAKPGDCGKTVADTFCRKWQWTTARDFRQENAGGRTRMLSGQSCNDKGCLGFAFITCTGRVTRQASFANPSLKGARLDWCMQYRMAFRVGGTAEPRPTSCGAPVADEFCKSKGFSQGHLYARPDPQPGGGPTWTIQGGSCRGSHCRGIQLITCRDEHQACVERCRNATEQAYRNRGGFEVGQTYFNMCIAACK
jgi:hypothetical protein